PQIGIASRRADGGIVERAGDRYRKCAAPAAEGELIIEVGKRGHVTFRQLFDQALRLADRNGHVVNEHDRELRIVLSRAHLADVRKREALFRSDLAVEFLLEYRNNF